jgi:hypothetical protein
VATQVANGSTKQSPFVDEASFHWFFRVSGARAMREPVQLQLWARICGLQSRRSARPFGKFKDVAT